MASFEQLRKRRAESERGAILVLTALVILLLLFIAAFSTGLGAWYRQTEEQQRAADVGALNGISAYDRGVKQVFGANGGGVDTWEELFALTNDLTLVREAERAGMIEAAHTIQALLETSGLTFSTPPTVDIEDNPLLPTSVSTVVLIADDGSIITIRRVFVQTGVDSDGDAVYAAAIEVNIEREGEQYFSNILREAPQIERSAQSLLSNCGATCNNPVTFNPPFVGFDAPGNGDGYTPLLRDNDHDGVVDEVWAVNHHANPGNNVGSIICYDAETTNACVPTQTTFPLPYFTHRSPVEYIHQDPNNAAHDGKIYFAASNGTLSGIACFDADARAYCATPFVGVFDIDNSANWSAYINVVGPFEHENRLYTVAQNGTLFCTDLDMTPCNTGGVQTFSTHPDLPGLQGDRGHKIANGEQLGDKLILTQQSRNGVIFICINLGNDQGSVSNCGETQSGLDPNGDKVITFTRYNRTGTPVGVCGFHVGTAANICVDFNAQNPQTLAGLTSLGGSFDADNRNGPTTTSFVGDAFGWNGERTFIGTGGNDSILCYDWTLADGGAPCTDGPDRGGAALLADSNFLVNVLGVDVALGRQDEGIQTYAFAQVSDRCIIALGDEAIFFSFDPVGFGPCVDVKIREIIAACDCANEAAGRRWGPLSLPAALLDDVEFLYGTVRAEDGSLLTDDNGNVIPELEFPINLLDTGGVIDLSVLNDLDPRPERLELTLDADSKLKTDGTPEFADPYTTNLAIEVQPTLTE